MKQINDATKIIEELIERGKTTKDIAMYMGVSTRAINHWRQGFRWGFKICPNIQCPTIIKNKTGPSDKSIGLLLQMLSYVRKGII